MHVRFSSAAASHLPPVSGSGEAAPPSVRLCDEAGQAFAVVGVGQRINLEIQTRANQYIPLLILGHSSRDKFGQIMYGISAFLKKKIVKDVKQSDYAYL